MTDFKKVFIDMSPLIYYHDNTEIIENFDRFLEYMNIKVIPIGTLIAKQGRKSGQSIRIMSRQERMDYYNKKGMEVYRMLQERKLQKV